MHQERYGRIVGWGAYTPEKRLTNHELSTMVETTDDWIVQRTGIRERRIAAPHETTATMSTEAARRALEMAHLTPNDIDLIIVGTSTQDHLVPSTASQVQHMLGANCPAFVVTTGCTGFVYGLSIAYPFIETGAYRTILVIGAELLSRFVNWADRSTCILFGDAAGAAIVQATDEPCGLLGFELGSDGSGGEHLIAPTGGAAEPLTADNIAEGRQFIQMNGREVFKFATRVLGRSCQASLAKADLTLDDIDWIVPHQANLRIVEAAARQMNVPLDRFIVNIQRYGNTSAASIPLAVAEAMEAGKITLDDRLLLVSFGGGLTWATAVLQQSPIRRQTAVYATNNGYQTTGIGD